MLKSQWIISMVNISLILKESIVNDKITIPK